MQSNLQNIDFFEDAYSTSYSYDAAGNILTLNRNGWVDSEQNFFTIDQLAYTYGPNSSKLKLVTDTEDDVEPVISQPFGFGKTTTTSSYTYDEFGYVTGDSNHGVNEAVYSFLKMPESMTTSGGTVQHYYAGSGNKVMTKMIGDETLKHRYIGEFQLKDDGIHQIGVPNGRIVEDDNGASSIQYHLTDHLGNVVVTFEDKDEDGEIYEGPNIENLVNEVTQRNMYYPYGMRMEHSGLKDEIDPEQRYLLGAKESMESFSYGWQDFQMRQYDNEIGRFTGIDALSTEYASWSGYNSFMNNPISLTDPTGMSVEGVDGGESQGQGINEFTQREENYLKFNSDNITEITTSNSNENTTANFEDNISDFKSQVENSANQLLDPSNPELNVVTLNIELISMGSTATTVPYIYTKSDKTKLKQKISGYPLPLKNALYSTIDGYDKTKGAPRFNLDGLLESYNSIVNEIGTGTNSVNYSFGVNLNIKPVNCYQGFSGCPKSHGPINPNSNFTFMYLSFRGVLTRP